MITGDYIPYIKQNLKVHTKIHHPGSEVKERIKRQLPLSVFFTSKKDKLDDILPDIEVTSNEALILQNATVYDFTFEEKKQKM